MQTLALYRAHELKDDKAAAELLFHSHRCRTRGHCVAKRTFISLLSCRARPISCFLTAPRRAVSRTQERPGRARWRKRFCRGGLSGEIIVHSQALAPRRACLSLRNPRTVAGKIAPKRGGVKVKRNAPLPSRYRLCVTAGGSLSSLLSPFQVRPCWRKHSQKLI